MEEIILFIVIALVLIGIGAGFYFHVFNIRVNDEELKMPKINASVDLCAACAKQCGFDKPNVVKISSMIK
jgi:hypothetical protein